jgi:hypothetical protein
VQDYVRDLIDTVNEAEPALLALGDEASARRPAPTEAELRRFLAVGDADHPIARQLTRVANPTAR